MNLDNSIFLVTGGTGSFGHAMVRRLLATKVSEIRIFSRDEKKQDDMRKSFLDDRLKFYIGDVRDRSAIDAAMKGVNFVFHAAALKQVPSCEFFPLEAVKTNVMGTSNVIEAAILSGVDRVVILSTDKAVSPVNAMGMSKALMEKVAISKAREIKDRSNTLICCTRYGNVIASRGSVVPLFFEQVSAGNPLTVTDRTMTRFMLTLDNAIELVLFAMNNTKGGEVFVMKAPGASVDTVVSAIKSLINKDDYPIQNIGIRHGEKLHEVLVSSEEMKNCIDEKDFYIIPPDIRDLNYEKYFTGANINHQSNFPMHEYSSSQTVQLNAKELIDLFACDPNVSKLIQKFHNE